MPNDDDEMSWILDEDGDTETDELVCKCGHTRAQHEGPPGKRQPCVACLCGSFKEPAA